MGKFIPGKWQYSWNTGTGDVRIYDVFMDGRVREKIAKSGEMSYIEPKYAIQKLDEIINYYQKCADKFQNVNLYGKVYATKVEIHKQIRQYIKEKNRL